MSALSIQVPFPVFNDRDGQPLDNGYVWIGVANLPPQTNPVNVYFDSGLTISAPQPLRTINGYISNAGTPAQVYVDGADFSILVQDSKGTMVYNYPSGTGIGANACGLTYDPPFDNAVSYPVCEKLAQTVSVKDFGAVGDGITNDYVAIQAAIDALVDGGTLNFENGATYLIGSRLQGSKSIKVVGNGATIKGSSAMLATSTSLWSIANRKSTTGGVSISVTQNGNSFTIPSGVSVSPGDMVLMKSTTVYYPDPSGTDYLCGQWARVNRVSGSTAYINGLFLAGAYTATTIEVYDALDKTSITGLTFDVSNTDTANPILTSGLIYQGGGILVDNCQFIGNSNAGMGLFVEGENANVTNSTFSEFLNLQGIGGGGRLGYGVKGDANGTIVRGCVFNDCKHSFSSSSRSFVVVGDILVTGCTVNESFTSDNTQFIASLDLHVGVVNKGVFSNNTINCYKRAFLCMNGRMHVEGNVVNHYVAGTFFAVNNKELSDVRIIGNKFSGVSGSYLMDVDEFPFDGASNVLIADNTFTGGGVIIWDTTNVTMQGVTITNNFLRDSNAFLNIAPTNSTSFIMQGWMIDGNRVLMRSTTQADRVIKIASATANNKNAVVAGIDISNNTFAMDLNTDLGYIIAFDNCVMSDIKIRGNNLIRGNSGTSAGARNIQIKACDLTDAVIANNTMDSGFDFQSSGADCDFTNVLIDANQIGTGITVAESSGEMLLFNCTIQNNSIGSTIAFFGTGYANSDPTLIQGNTISGGSTYSVRAEKALVVDNVLKYEFNTGTYYAVPRNIVLNGAQSWKGGTTVTPEGDIVATAAPASGTWAHGDRVWNSTPSAGGTPGWVCTTAGTPGTWKAMANVAA